MGRIQFVIQIEIIGTPTLSNRWVPIGFQGIHDSISIQ